MADIPKNFNENSCCMNANEQRDLKKRFSSQDCHEMQYDVLQRNLDEISDIHQNNDLTTEKVVDSAKKAAHRRALSFANPNYSLNPSNFSNKPNKSQENLVTAPASHSNNEDNTKMPDTVNNNSDMSLLDNGTNKTTQTFTDADVDRIYLSGNDSDGAASTNAKSSTGRTRKSSLTSDDVSCSEIPLPKISSGSSPTDIGSETFHLADNGTISLGQGSCSSDTPTKTWSTAACKNNLSTSVSNPKTTSTKETKSKSSSGPNIIQSAAYSIKNFIVPNYKYRNEEFKRLFKTIPETERFLLGMSFLAIGVFLGTNYSCAYQREILVHGRMYLSHSWLCFHANIFRWETTLTLALKEIAKISKERTAKVIPNAIQVTMKSGEKYFFTSFAMRDKAHMVAFRLWQSALLDQFEQPVDLWTWAQHGYHESDLIDEFPKEKLDLANEDKASILTSSSSENYDNVNIGRVRSESVLASSKNQLACTSLNTNCNATRRLSAVDSTGLRSTKKLIKKLDGCDLPVDVHLPIMSSICMDKSQLGISTPGEEDMTESSYENDDVEISCSCLTHDGKEMLNETYPISVDQLFLLLFTDSTFFRSLQEYRKTTNMTLNDWHTDKSSGVRLRQLSYTVALNHALGPKSCEVTEKQICAQCSKTGKVYVVKCECQNMGVPYADSFYVVTSYCLSRISANQCRLRLHGCVVYRSRCWGIVKSFIEKNANAGMQDYFSDLSNHLKMECEQLGFSQPDAPKPDDENIPREEHSVSSLRRSATPPRSPIRKSIGIVYPLLPTELETLTKVILFIMVLILACNFALFFKLWSMEVDYEQKSLESTLYALKAILHGSEPMKPTELIQLLKVEKMYNDQQKLKLLGILKAAINSVDQLEKILNDLKLKLDAVRQSLSKIDSSNLKDRATTNLPGNACVDRKVCESISQPG